MSEVAALERSSYRTVFKARPTTALVPTSFQERAPTRSRLTEAGRYARVAPTGGSCSITPAKQPYTVEDETSASDPLASCISWRGCGRCVTVGSAHACLATSTKGTTRNQRPPPIYVCTSTEDCPFEFSMLRTREKKIGFHRTLRPARHPFGLYPKARVSSVIAEWSLGGKQAVVHPRGAPSIFVFPESGVRI